MVAPFRGNGPVTASRYVPSGKQGAFSMFAVIAGALVLVLAVAIVRWIAAVPLIRTLSASMDSWADEVRRP